MSFHSDMSLHSGISLQTYGGFVLPRCLTSTQTVAARRQAELVRSVDAWIHETKLWPQSRLDKQRCIYAKTAEKTWKPPPPLGARCERVMRFELTTFCMASRCSSH